MRSSTVIDIALHPVMGMIASAYDAAGWQNLFTATASASATLTGLVFVSVSINLRSILKSPGLPERAFEPLVLLLGVLVSSVLTLVPQGRTLLGIELVAESILKTTIVVLLINTGRKHRMKRIWIINRSALAALGTGPFLIGAISLLLGRGGGLAWVVAGILGSIVGSVYSAWIVLVEIHR